MKRKFTLIFLCLQAVVLTAFAQTVLTYSSHGMNEGDILVLKEIEGGLTPTPAGPNQIWDYSGARINGSHVIHYNADGFAEKKSAEKAFACEQDGELMTYFNVSSTQKLYNGKVCKNAKIEFEEPIKEMVYPFMYNSEITGKMKGTYTTLSTGDASAIDGEYSVVGDSYGTLILPNGVKLKDVLRVKYVKDYTQMHCKNLFHITVNRYLFYSSNSRYPVMQIIESKTDCDCACSSTRYFACYDDNVKSNYSDKKEETGADMPNFTYQLYPNPFDKEFSLEYSLYEEAKVKISIHDMTGKEIKVLNNSKLAQGDYSLLVDLDSAVSATYILQIKVGSKVYTEKLIKK